MPKPESRMSLTVNGHQLDGIKVKGKWQFTCSFPEMAKQYSGAADMVAAVGDFTKLALAAKAKVPRA